VRDTLSLLSYSDFADNEVLMRELVMHVADKINVEEAMNLAVHF
jgi:hypothetical protein